MASVRARRPPSPPPLGKGIPPTAAVAAPAPRFPPKQQQYLDADARRANASTRSRPRRRSAPGGLNLARAEWNLLVGVLIVGAAVRLFRISKPDSVVFDEVHFGKFAARYIKTRYFVDVHPPLAKLLITLAGFLFGFDGGFEFEDIAKPFPTDVPYVAMRMLPALMGLWTVPLGYMTLRMLDVRATSALLASTLLIFDNALVTQSRHILLDAPLVFFTALTIFFWVGFGNEDKERPFSEGWWAWLVLTGLSLGAVVSCKWVGLFTIATVGLGTLSQLWTLLGDTRVPPRLWLKHLLARALCLIVLPILFYMFMFQIHFAVLQNSGEGDGFMSPEFQHTLGGHRMVDTYADVVVGSEVTIRHVNTNGGYLHSHAHNYPTGSRQQHVTLYPHIDDNNNWRIVNATSAGDPYSDWVGIVPVQHIVDGARVKIRHIATDRSLHSHDYRPPVSEVEFQNEVSAYGMAGFEGDANDDWIVEIDATASADRVSRKRLRTLRTVFKLKHPLTGCYLFSHKVKLPAWGFDQQEVTCNKNAVRANSLWMVETNSQPNLPLDAPKVNYRTPGFIEKFLELNSVMWTTNAGLTERHTFDSRPSSWPVLRRGINFWVKDHRQIYLTGNPFVWWLSTAAVVSYVAVRALLILRAKRGFHDFENSKVVKYDTLCGFLFIAWSLHYLPFFLMSRQLFLHHYLPALYFAVLLSAAVFDFMAAALKPVYRLGLAAVLAVVVVWNFAVFSPLAYGLPWTRDKCQAAQWRKTWDFSCSDFHTDYAKYAIDAHATPVGGQAAVQPQAPPAVATIEAGRGVPVVVNVNDHQLSANDTDAEETQVERGKAEPGRDIFGAGAGGGKEAVVMPSSAAVQVGRKVDEGAKEEEEVEKIVVDAGKVVPQVGKVDEGAKVEKEAVVGGADAKPPAVESVKQEQQQQQQKLATSEEEHVKLYTAPAGPKDHEDTEADEVRDELFPGEAKA